MGLELNFSGPEAENIVKEISAHSLPTLSLGGKLYFDARAESHLYRFGVGMIQVSFKTHFDLARCAEISCNAEKIAVGKTGILEWCQMRAKELIDRAQEFAIHRYDLRLTESELFPVFILPQEKIENADSFIRENYRALYGIVAGEPDFDQLSDFVFQREPLANFGYYENELILLKRFGAVVSSSESGTILDLISLVYAQYWSLKSYLFVLDQEMDDAKKLLEDLPPYYKFWQIPARYRRFNTELIDFGKDKLSIVDSLYSVSANIPKVDSDWHLRTIYKDLAEVFNINERYKNVEVKLNRIGESYEQGSDYLATNFFILLDIIFFVWLAWGIVDTVLLFTIARK